MKNTFLSILFATAFSCEPILMHMSITQQRIWRCENDEVICYVNRVDGGLSCKFKELDND